MSFSSTAAAVDPPWLTKARSFVGFHEQSGNRGIAEFINLAGYGAEGDPWCSIFVGACLKATGYPNSGSALALSYERSPNFVRLDKPALGAIVTMWRGSKDAGTGHVTFNTGEQGGKIMGLGGNQADQVMIEPFPEDAHITGYWWPKTAPLPGEVAVVAPTPAGKVFTVTATWFGGPTDAQPVAYSDVAPGWADRPGVALPYRFHGLRPKIRVTYQGKSVDCDVVDVGPHSVNDDYWTTGTRPKAESQSGNHSGIDLTPAAAHAIGFPVGAGHAIVEWCFVLEAPMPATQPAPAPVPAPAPAIAIPQEQIAQVIQTLTPLIQQNAPAIEAAVAAGLARALPAIKAAAPAIASAIPGLAPLLGMLGGPGMLVGVIASAITLIVSMMHGATGTAWGPSATETGQILATGVAGGGVTWLGSILHQIATGVTQKGK